MITRYSAFWAAIILCVFLFSGCEPPKGTPTNYGPWIYTADHDGHKFVVIYKHATGSAEGGLSAIHHPDCKCEK